MQISVTLLLCVFIACCTGLLSKVAASLRVQAGQIAAVSLLLAALSAFDIAIAGRLTVNVASLLCVTLAYVLCRKQREIYIGVLLAFLSGIIAWFLQRTLHGFPEPSILTALPVALLSHALPIGARKRCLCLTLSPIFFGLANTLEEWYFFDVASFSIGNALQLNAQIMSLVLSGVLSVIIPWKGKKNFVVQKEY